MKKLFLPPLMALLMSQGSIAAAPEEDRSSWSSNDYWESTQLNFQKLVYGTFNKTSCSSAVKSMLGCVAAVNKMRALQNPNDTVLVKLALDGSGDFIEEKIDDPRDYKSAYTNYLKNLKTRLEEMDSALTLIPINIEEKVSTFEQRYVTEANDSMSAGQLYNEYLVVAEDPHSYLTPLTKVQDQSKDSKPRKGIGIMYKPFMDGSQKTFIISEVVPDSPAAKSGIKAGDVIVSANEEIDAKEISRVIKTQDPIDFLMRRKTERGMEEKKIHLVKGVYRAASVKPKLIARNGKKYAYVRLSSFMSPNACKNIHKNAKEMIDQGAEGFILDLRNNGGGRVDQATCIMGMYLEDGSTAWATRTVESNIIREKKLRRNPGIGQIFKNMHTVTLINGYSASASEALAMYLKDYRKTFVMGERSFGKGSMQRLFYYRENRNILNAKTQALYYGPKGISPQVRGVLPDLTAYPNADQSEPTKFVREEDRYTFPIRDKEVNPSEYIDPERVDQIADIKTCMQTEKANNGYDSLDEIEKALYDNQLQEALDALECAERLVPIHTGTKLKKNQDYLYMQAW